MVVVLCQSAQRGLGPARVSLDSVLTAREVVSGKENGLRLRLGSGFRCGVMENGGRFHGRGAHTPDTPTSTFPERPSKFKMPQAPGAGGALTAGSPHWLTVLSHFCLWKHLSQGFPFSLITALSLDRLRPREGQLTAASKHTSTAGCKMLPPRAGPESSSCPLAGRQQLAQMKSYTVRLSGLVSGKRTVLPLSRPAASFPGVYPNTAWSHAANLGTRGSLPHKWFPPDLSGL